MHAYLRTIAALHQTRTPRADRLVRDSIMAGGVFVLLALAWVHLGLGAWLLPPAAITSRLQATAGPYQVTLGLASSQLEAHPSPPVRI